MQWLILSALLWASVFWADALLKIQISIDSKAFGIQKWWLILAVAILTGAAGFLLVFTTHRKAPRS